MAANHNKKQWEGVYKTELMVMNRKDAMVTGCRSVDVLYFFFFLLSNSIVLFIVPCWGGRSHKGVRLVGFLLTLFFVRRTTTRLLPHPPVSFSIGPACAPGRPPFWSTTKEEGGRFAWVAIQCWFLISFSFFFLYSPVIVVKSPSRLLISPLLKVLKG
jgi:hypothetical protein